MSFPTNINTSALTNDALLQLFYQIEARILVAVSALHLADSTVQRKAERIMYYEMVSFQT